MRNPTIFHDKTIIYIYIHYITIHYHQLYIVYHEISPSQSIRRLFLAMSRGDPAGQASELGVKAGMVVPWLTH